MNKSFAALLTILIAATNALSQSFTLDSFTKAKAVLDRSATAYGGREALNAIANVSIRLGGESVHRNQSRKPGDLDRTEYTGQVIIDLKNSRALQTQKGHYPGGFDWYNGFVVDNNVRTGFDFIRKTSSPPGEAIMHWTLYCSNARTVSSKEWPAKNIVPPRQSV